WPEECVVPENRIASSDRFQTPVLWLYGKKDVMSGEGDRKKARRHFPRSEFVTFEDSACMPFVEENGRFTEVVKAFLAKYRPKETKAGKK
ncbi:MAG: alpha/beta fold hydrolase, partial [Planctomycetota bacterium]